MCVVVSVRLPDSEVHDVCVCWCLCGYRRVCVLVSVRLPTCVCVGVRAVTDVCVCWRLCGYRRVCLLVSVRLPEVHDTRMCVLVSACLWCMAVCESNFYTACCNCVHSYNVCVRVCLSCV